MSSESLTKDELLARLAAAQAENSALRATRIQSSLRITERNELAFLRAQQEMRTATAQHHQEVKSGRFTGNQYQKAASEVDMAFMMDCTGSMSSWIAAAKEKVLSIIPAVQQQFPDVVLRCAFVAYRDIGDGQLRHEILPFTSNLQEVTRFIGKLVATGGDDGPEDIAGALEQVIEGLDWSSVTRTLIHVCDAPCHGKIFHSYSDNYPNGDPSGLNPLAQMKQLASLGITYNFARIHNCTDKMMEMFRAAYDAEARARSGMLMNAQELSSGPSKFLSFVVGAITESITHSMTTMSRASSGPRVKPELDTTPPDWKSDPRFGKGIPGIVHTPPSRCTLEELLEIKNFLVQPITVQIFPKPFAAGSERMAFYARDNAGNKLVAKQYMSSEVKSVQYMQEVQSQTIAKVLTSKFNERKPPQHLDYVVARVFKPDSRKGGATTPYFLEPFVEGEYIKYNNNGGSVSGKGEFNLSAQAFSHFSWVATAGSLIAVDLQGYNQILTDPVIHTRDKKHLPLRTNFNDSGIIRFFSTHKCNKVCLSVGLKPHPSMSLVSLASDQKTISYTDVGIERKDERIQCANINCTELVERHASGKETWCESCFTQTKKKKTGVCVDCAQTFKYHPFYYVAKGMSVPTRCEDCIEARRKLGDKDARVKPGSSKVACRAASCDNQAKRPSDPKKDAWCDRCIAKMDKKLDTVRKCRVCHDSFGYSAYYYSAVNLRAPTRCQTCRSAARGHTATAAGTTFRSSS